MNFDTRPTNAQETVPQLRRVDREPELEEGMETAVPTFTRRERVVRERPAREMWVTAVFRGLWCKMSKAQALAVGLGLGLVIGLPLLGWWLWPVEWTNASFNELAPAEQALVIETVADYYAYSADPVRVGAVLNGWRDGESLICAMAAQEDDFWARARLISIAAVRNGRGCE